jgi:ATP-dependent Zn protease
MNAPLSREVLLRAEQDAQRALELATAGVARWVWESRYGPMLIEVAGGEVFVNGDRVEPHVAAGKDPVP